MTEDDKKMMQLRKAWEGERACLNCRHWSREPWSIVGDCRRHPPVLMEKSVGWPQIEFSDWCGEFAEDDFPKTKAALEYRHYPHLTPAYQWLLKRECTSWPVGEDAFVARQIAEVRAATDGTFEQALDRADHVDA